jgi:osmotically-inducible protein OsmY
MRKIHFGTVALIGCLAAGLFSCTGGVPKASDQQIIDDSLARLKMDSRLMTDDFQVQSKNRIVTLTGHVDTLNQKYLAETIVGSTNLGIRQIINQINVFAPVIEDQIIVGDIQDGLGKEPRLKGTDIKVDINKGVVHLSGTVKTAEQRRLAMEVAARPQGVVNVVPDIKVLAEHLPDADIAKEVNTYLRVSPLVRPGQVSVSVKDGVVHLTGEVDHLMGKVMLIEDIGQLRGVNAVESEIQVE